MDGIDALYVKGLIGLSSKAEEPKVQALHDLCKEQLTRSDQETGFSQIVEALYECEEVAGAKLKEALPHTKRW